MPSIAASVVATLRFLEIERSRRYDERKRAVEFHERGARFFQSGD
jgi:hypothetical protein